MKTSMIRLSQNAAFGALLIATAFGGGLARAESVLFPATVSTNPALPNIPEPKQGEPLRLTWQDGRQAVLRIRKPTVVHIPLKLKVTENLCEDRIARPAGNCTFRVANQKVMMDFAWEKHPESSKIGQTVKSFYYNPPGSDGQKQKFSEPTEGQDFVSSGSKLIDPSVSTDEVFDDLTCDDFHWLTGAEDKAAPNELTIDAWNAEFMLSNPETNESENRGFGGGYGLKFMKTGPQTMRLAAAQSLSSYFGGSPSLFGDVIGLVLRQKAGPNTGETCQVTLKPNLGEAMLAAAQAQEEANKNAKFVPVTDFRETTVRKFLQNGVISRFLYLMNEGGFE